MTSSQDRPHFFYTAPPGACPYLPHRIERKILVDLATPDANFLHSRLSHAGFRRSHTLAYAPICDGCSACIPIRLPVSRLTPNRTQKRAIRRNADLIRSLLPPPRQTNNTRSSAGIWIADTQTVKWRACLCMITGLWWKKRR